VPLTTPGPTVTVALPPGGTTALVSVTAGVQGSSGSISCYMSFTVSGVTNTLVVMDSHALTLVSNQLQQASASFVITGLSGASATFTAQYRGSGGTCNYQNRSIWAIPLPVSGVGSG
jgi:hypothetical protein